MKTRYWGAGLALIAAVLMTAGCGSQPKPSPMAESPSGAPAAVSLGESAAAGPFEVTLSSRNDQISTESAELVAEVKRDGEPLTDAKVTVHLTAPDAKTSDVPLKWAGARYTGRADLAAAGDWQARVEVEAGGATGTATYAFSVHP